MGWHEELVFTETSEEGAGLSGLLTEADRAVGPAVIYIHGFPIDAFLPFSSAIARGLASRGYTTLQANTRGAGVAHQIYCRDGPSMLGGGWLELFSESPRDIDVWITFMESRGISRVVLLGVSFGGLKTVYYLTERADPRVAGAIVAQAPMPGADRINSAERPDPERVALARRLVAEGRELDFLWRQYGDPSGAVSARTYLDRVRIGMDFFGIYTPDPRIARVRCPLFLCYGGDDAGIANADDVAVAARNAKGSPRVDVRIVEHAVHAFIGREDEAAAIFADWIRTLG